MDENVHENVLLSPVGYLYGCGSENEHVLNTLFCGFGNQKTYFWATLGAPRPHLESRQGEARRGEARQGEARRGVAMHWSCCSSRSCYSRSVSQSHLFTQRFSRFFRNGLVVYCKHARCFPIAFVYPTLSKILSEWLSSAGTREYGKNIDWMI